MHRLLIQYQKKHTQILRQYQWCTEMVLNIQFCTLSPQLHPELLDREVPLLESKKDKDRKGLLFRKLWPVDCQVLVQETWHAAEILEIVCDQGEAASSESEFNNSQGLGRLLSLTHPSRRVSKESPVASPTLGLVMWSNQIEEYRFYSIQNNAVVLFIFSPRVERDRNMYRLSSTSNLVIMEEVSGKGDIL